jgi:hypothetical protein
MRIKPRPLVIDPQNPFAADQFNRKRFAEALEKIVVSSTDGAVLSLEAEWGEGKSTFVRMWMADLALRSISCIYIDAFRIDGLGDPFSAITAEIDAFARKLEVKSEIIPKAKTVARGLARLGLKVGLKAATLGIIGSKEWDEFEEVRQTTLEAQDKVLEASFERQLSEYQSASEAARGLQKTLSDLGGAVREKTQAPLIVIVDELDRCAPRYAVDFLEAIKHYFNADNINFLLVINPGQLEETLRGCYGAGINARRYLQKFIDVSMTLPRPEAEERGKQLERFCHKLIESHEINHYGDIGYMAMSAAQLALIFNSPLREIEKIITRVCLAYTVFSDRHIRPFDLISYLCFLRQCDPVKYGKIRDKRVDVKSLVDDLIPPMRHGYDTDWVSRIREWLIWCLLTDEEIAQLPEAQRPNLGSLITRYNIRRSTFIEFVCSLIENVGLRDR